MLGNGIKQTTATTGPGNLTVAPVTGYPAVSDVLPLNFPFEYTALDPDGLFKESGIGYMSASSTLVRARICATFSGGVYNAANPTALSLTGTTTIICTPHAASVESMAPTIDSQSASVSRYVSSAGRSCIASPAALTALRVYYTPFLLRVGAPIASLMVAVTTQGAASTVARAGIYTLNEKGYPGALLATTSDLDTSSTGNKVGTLASPLFLPPGWYVAALVASGTPTLHGYTSGLANIIGGSPFGMSTAFPPVAIDFRMETVGSAVLPTTASTTTTASNIGVAHGPMVHLGVA